MNEKYFYQIDFIDSDGLANYISVHNSRRVAIYRCDILQDAHDCISTEGYYVVDKYKEVGEEDNFISSVYNGKNRKELRL